MREKVEVRFGTEAKNVRSFYERAEKSALNDGMKPVYCSFLKS